MRRLFQFFFLLLAVVFNSPLKAALAETRPFKVGVITALTGPAAANGIAMQNSIALAVKASPEKFSNIKFIYEDGSFNSRQALTSFMKLKDIDNVDLVYAWGVTYCKPIAPIALSSQIPVICQGIEQDSYRNNPFLIRFMNSTHQYASLLWEYFRSKNWKSVGLVLAENPYMEGMAEALRLEARDGEKVEVIDRYAVGTVDMVSTLTKLSRAKYDAVGIYLAPGQIGPFYKLMARQRMKLPTFGTNCFENVDEILLSEGAMEGGVYVHNLIEPSFIENYEKAYGNQSQLAFGAMSYEFAELVGDLFGDKKEPPAAQQIIAAFAAVGVRTGKATGAFRLVQEKNGDRYFNFPFAVKEVHGTSYRILLGNSD